MGALTLKSFPFELRGWDLQKYENLDYTDSFGTNTQIYVLKNQIVQIEIDSSSDSLNEWITDKGRVFFDSVFTNFDLYNNKRFKNENKSNLTAVLDTVIKELYMLETCYLNQNKNSFLTIIFENINLEILNMLNLLKSKNDFLNVKKIEKISFNNDLENNFTTNLINNNSLMKSNMGIVVSTNTRYEGSNLNLKLKQRFLKGHFQLFVIGSFINLTFPSHYVGSNINSLKLIIEGNSSICQAMQHAKNPFFVLNSQIFKRNENNFLNYFDTLNKKFNNINILAPTLCSTGEKFVNKFENVNKKDFINNNIFYLMNVSSNNFTELNNILNFKFLNYNKNDSSKKKMQNTLINSNFIKEDNNFKKLIENTNQIKNYLHIPSKSFYSTNNTFINTEGIYKRSIKIIHENNRINSYNFLKKIIKQIKQNNMFIKKKDLLFLNEKSFNKFENYASFHYTTTKTLSNLGNLLIQKFKPFKLNKKIYNGKSKINLTKLKYWIDDFFNDGKDEYTTYSKILSKCSTNIRMNQTNFF